MRHTLTALVVLGSLVLGPARAVVAADPVRRVVFLLDCSRAMEANLASGGEIREVASTASIARMAAAQDALKATLTRLSEGGGCQAGVWLYGHRLAWGEGPEPELMEQTDYLEQTLGFRVLRDLLPGDDVELARPLTRLDADSLPPFFVRLDAAKPWGEAPLYLALTRAIDNLGREVTGLDTSFVVITSGTNRQGLCRFQTGKDTLLSAAEKRGIPIHFIVLGNADEPNRQSEAEFEQIATATRGSLARAANSAELLARVDEALKARRPAPATVAAAALAPTAGEPIKTVADGPAASPAPTTRTVEGQIVCYGQPVRGARVALEGSGVPPTVTDAAGRFVFNDVPGGSYRLAYEATVKNMIRSGAKPLRVEPKADEPLALKLVLQ